MARKLAFVLSFIGLCLATAVYALGLGSIQSTSSLNEPLSARVPLLGVDADEASSISVELASPEAFERAGVDRPFSLSRLNFEVKQDSEGPYIEITTKEAVKEPFLDFLMEIRWPEGRLVREYTLLLDPPTYAPGDETPATQAPAVADDADTADEPEQRPSQEPSTVGGARSSGAPDLGQVSEMGDDQEAGDDQVTAGEYGPVQTNDTLWEIAQRTRPDASVSVNQTMLAILRANPDAFINGDMNRLKRGAILRVPESGEIASIPVAEANAEVRRQIEKWQRNRAVAGDTGGDAEEGGEGSTQAQAQTGQQEQQGEGELRVVAPEEGAGEEPATSAQGEGAAQELRQQVTLLKESNASLESENEDLKSQVEALKKEVAQLEDRVNVQTDQAMPGAQQPEGQQPQQQPSAEDEPAAEQPQQGEQAADEAEKTTPTDAPDVAADEGQQPADEPASEAEEQATQAEESEQQPTPTEQPETAQTEPATEEPEAQPEPAEPEPTATPLWQDPMVMGTVGAVALVILLAAYVVMRRRSAGEDEIQDLSDQVAFNLDSQQGQGGGDFAPIFEDERGDEEEDDTPLTGFSEEETAEMPPENDPVSEAEVYLAYGRYDQAQELLEGALGRDPANKEARVKLLEVLALTQDRAAFEDQAQQLHERVDSDDDPAWQRAREMGREVAPEHPLFGNGPARTKGSEAADSDMDFELPTEDEQAPAPQQADEPTQAAAAPTDEFSDLDFSFEDSGKDESAPEPAGETEEPAAGLEDLEFDLEEVSPESPQTGGGQAERESEELSLDFNLDEDQPLSSPARDDGETTDTAATESGGSDDLANFDFSFDEGESGADADLRDESEATTRDVDMQSTATSADTDYGLNVESAPFGEDDAELLDEVSTKLDLARAYMDMGDDDGARALLDEVVEEGNDAQIKEARELLDKAS